MENRIVMAREYADLSQKELARRMGISPSTLNGYEKGNHDPKPQGLANIATICGVTVDYLLGLTEEPGAGFTVTVSDTDPQMDELNRWAEMLSARGLQKVVDYASDLAGNPEYQKRPLYAPDPSGDAS
ncbi:MAG: helix-turn-helix domain-containing protein [Clostridiales bacterium]|nr:helix-turn-helix domain-containing protein [Clostridiales bacterium]